jgi:hypothetical protein
MKTLIFDLHLPNPFGHLVVRDKDASVNHRYAIDLHAPDFSAFDLLTAQEKTECSAALIAQLDGQQIDAHPEPEFPPPTDLELWGTVRTKRTQLLRDTDWTVLADAPLTAAQKTAWEAYRQALRDLPAQDVGPGDVVWPSAP